MVFCNLNNMYSNVNLGSCHNPYFNRWFSAILLQLSFLFSFKSHNPYFNRWFSAMKKLMEKYGLTVVTILILIDGFLQ